MIRIPQVRVVDEEGAQLGVMPTPEALAMAQERGLDLVEVAPMAAPPVVKFLDFGQYKYELTKREKEAKRKQRSVTFKEVRLKPKIGTGDFDTKVRRAIQFLEEGDRIKVAVQFRGRELTHPEIGRALLARFSDQIKDHGVVERAPLLEGKSMHITVGSVHKPKAIEHAARHGAETEGERPAGEVSGAPAPAGASSAAASAPAAPAASPTPADVPAGASATPPDVPAATTPRPAATAAPVPVSTAQAPATAPAKAAPAKATPAKAAPAKAAPAKATPASTSETPVRSAAPVSAPVTSAKASTPAAAVSEATKPAARPARTRKATEPEAPAPAPARE
jgi:translation initiation factor IF-3